MTQKIKILQDTPFDKAGTLLSIPNFRLKYYYIVNTHNSDYFLIRYILEDYKKDNLDVDLSKWFEVIEENSFKIGDWVWHEKMKQAFFIVNYNIGFKGFRPNYCTLEAVISIPQIYKRLATKEEIEFYNLTTICEGDILIGRYKSYYFNNVWKEIKGIQDNIRYYLECYKKSTLKIETSDNKYLCTFNGLKVGCKAISHQEIITIASILNIN